MYEYRVVYVARRATLTVGFEQPEQAEAFAKEIGGSWEGIRLYLAGHGPSTWTVHTAEARVGQGVTTGCYTVSSVEAATHESEPATLVAEGDWARVLGTDKDRVADLLDEWLRVKS